MDLTEAILANIVSLSVSYGSAIYDANTNFTGTGFGLRSAGWMLVPERGTPDGPSL